jgi:hypothetical protein
MPMTASGQAEKLDMTNAGRIAFTRVMAGIEALILAGVLYLVASVRSQEISMAEIKAASAAAQQSMSALPALTIRVVEAEKDIQANTQSILENKARIKELEDRANRRSQSTAKGRDDFSL